MSNKTEQQKLDEISSEMIDAIAAAETAKVAVDAVNPGSAHRQDVPADGSEEIQYTLDPQMIAQATQNKNARLIAMMVHENAMLEVALEQERRARQDAENKYEALLASLQD